jgi:D-arabinose 1-dehydrogenase-like Zn-dependent alcohol dehydrogenase
MRVNERFAFKIPDNIPNELAAPLMCAGGTLYEPVMNYVGAHILISAAVALCTS